MSYVYLASPYSHPCPAMRECRYLMAMAATAEMIRQGLVVFSPIVHSHPLAVAHDLGLDFKAWEHIDHAMIRACERVIVLKLEGWEESHGVQAEIQYARRKGKTVAYMDAPA